MITMLTSEEIALLQTVKEALEELDESIIAKLEGAQDKYTKSDYNIMSNKLLQARRIVHDIFDDAGLD